MKVSELMAGYTPSDEFAGFATNDDWVLAVGINLEEEATEKDYTVVQMGIAGLDPQMNPVTQDKQYIRTGLSTSKTGTQRTFAITGDRYIGTLFRITALAWTSPTALDKRWWCPMCISPSLPARERRVRSPSLSIPTAVGMQERTRQSLSTCAASGKTYCL